MWGKKKENNKKRRNNKKKTCRVGNSTVLSHAGEVGGGDKWIYVYIFLSRAGGGGDKWIYVYILYS